MPCVEDLLARKGRTVHTVEREARVADAIVAMVERRVGSLVVTAAGQVAGIFTERDVLMRVAMPGRDARATRVEEVMTPDPVCVEADCTLDDCMAIMTRQRIRHLPVLAGGRLAGLVSIGDLVKLASLEREVEVRRLTDYIAGRYPA